MTDGAGSSEDRLADPTQSIEDYFAFAGRGISEQILDLDVSGVNLARHRHRMQHVLGPWRSTAICGNDITSSVLYVSALCAAQAGVWAPLVLLAVGMVLYLYRSVYAEVGSALPLNGGTYTLLLILVSVQDEPIYPRPCGDAAQDLVA